VDVFYVTFDVAFLNGSVSSGFEQALVVFDVFTSVFWMMDLMINFVTGYLDSLECVVVMQLRPAVANYLKTWFFVDLIPTAGSVAASIVEASTATKLVVAVRLLKVTKLVRVVKMSVHRKRIAKVDIRAHSQILVCFLCILQIMFALFAVSHLMACLVWIVAWQNSDQDISERSWASDYVLPEASHVEQYVTSLHLSLSILAGGPVSFTTTLVSEQWVFCLFYILAWAMMGILVNEIASIYAKMSERSVEVRYTLAEASSFMACHKVPADLKTRIERYRVSLYLEVISRVS
jgi:hypothetical protein